MQAGVAAVVIDVAISMIAEIIKDKKRLQIIVMIGAFIAVFVLKINAVTIIIASGSIGTGSMFYLKYKKRVVN